MQSREHVDDVVCRHVDGTLDAGDREQVVAHLALCRECARDVAVQQMVRTALRRHAHTLGETAPDALRARVTGLAATPASPANVVRFPVAPPIAPRRRWARFVPVSVAAALLLAFGVGAFSPAGTVLAAQLVLDHLKCRAIATVTPGAEAAELARSWEQSWGWPVAVPASRSDLGLALVGLRNCLYHDGTMAHLMYDYRGHRVSLFVMPHRGAGAHQLAMLGQQTDTWVADGRTYAVVTDVAAGSVDDIAAYFRQAVR